MKLGIIGLPNSGKSTVFEALTQTLSTGEKKGESRISTMQVPDERLTVLSNMFKPKKTIYAQMEYFLPGVSGQTKDQKIWHQVRDCNALIHVVRNFSGYGFDEPAPYDDFHALDQELILADLVVVEKRLERIEQDKQRGRKVDPEELSLLNQCLKKLETEVPLRKFPELTAAPTLKGYGFVSAKPILVLFNNDDDDDRLPVIENLTDKESCMLIRGKLEQELAQMSAEEVEDFLEEFNIPAPATDRAIKRSFEVLGLISFFTFVNEEVKAWTITKDTVAVDAAEVIHSDMKRGFIRAEVVAYNDLVDAGSYAEARKKGTVRLEGKQYMVQDGDVITFRFNV
ncbi:MAG: redox-regulated ATPase YchF [Desulfobacterales bacterium]|uniref:Redox-regulated ATPase YchF n=1 Tax=Candidatus Desulfatibia profunda TaxID=2841695 RepID=A0A8J6NT78_9BACT|nr:redox-regulated ATPase YchF [Candidatus Desulfatibia profunda]MBL7179520.1 redox-regulated ATPase YchF [Desulfobacterales bacterium]